MMTSDPIQTLWIGSGLSQLEQLALTSFVAHGHTVHLYSYELTEKDVPLGVEIKDANEIIPSREIFVYGEAAKEGKGSVSAFSNIFRYKLLFDRGGWWIDSDVICLKPLPDCDALVSQERHPHGKVQAASCVLHFPAGSDVPRFCYETANAVDRTTLKWGQIGPNLVDQALTRFNQRSILAHPDDFCPINWFESERTWKPGVRWPKRTYAVHLWNEMWRRAGLDKRATPPENSIYHRLLLQYDLLYPDSDETNSEPSEKGIVS